MPDAQGSCIICMRWILERVSHDQAEFELVGVLEEEKLLGLGLGRGQ